MKTILPRISLVVCFAIKMNYGTNQLIDIVPLQSSRVLSAYNSGIPAFNFCAKFLKCSQMILLAILSSVQHNVYSLPRATNSL